MLGSATLTTLSSRTSMNCTKHSTTRAGPRRPAGWYVLVVGTVFTARSPSVRVARSHCGSARGADD